jgi:hypothetical protein
MDAQLRRLFDGSERGVIVVTWLNSRRGALTLSFFACLSLLARSYYDIRYILVDEFSQLAPQMDVLWFLAFTAIIGGNIAALLVATENRRGGWIALMIFNLIIGLGSGAASLVAYTSNTLELVIFTANLITGTLATYAVGWRLRELRAESASKSHNVA